MPHLPRYGESTLSVRAEALLGVSAGVEYRLVVPGWAVGVTTRLNNFETSLVDHSK